MEIAPYDPSVLPQLADEYNRVVRDVPHCYPVSEEDLAAVLPSAGAETGGDGLQSRAAFVATDAGAVIGLAETGLGKPQGPREGKQGVIRFLFYRSGRRAAGQALLDAAHEHLRKHKARYVQAFPQEYRYPFYHLHAAYLSDRLGHVAALLAFNGYGRIRGEIFLDWREYEPVEPQPVGVAAEMSVEWKQGRGKRPGVIVRAHKGRKEIGLCECISGGESSRAPAAQDWLFTLTLVVENRWQGKGLGKHLLRRALLEMKRKGYRHAAISTAWENHRAFLFYSNFGYHVSDWTYGLGRPLK